MKRLLCLILSLSLLLTGVLPCFAASGDRSAAMDTRQSGRLFAPLRHLRTRLTGALIDLYNRLYTISKEEPIYHPTAGEPLAQTPFFASSALFKREAERTVLPFNAVVRLFGGSDEAHTLVYRFGNEPTYYDWMAQKLVWTGDDAYVRELKDKIVGFPQTDNGYLWSWGTSTYWPTGKGELHYDGLFRYVAAVAELVRWDADTAFLEEIDETAFGADAALDASRGRTVYEKCRLALQYADEQLGGRDGLITLTERSAYLADGVTRFDKNENGEYVWNNTGRAGSASSNYWDNLCFGHQDAYETMLYYRALLSMRDIEVMRGDAAAAAACEAHAAKVKDAFNRAFWDAKAGRYIACIDADGKRWDPGLTFLNTEALYNGLGDRRKAASIFSWIDGTRIVRGDTLRGKQILNYAQVLATGLNEKNNFGYYPFAPVTNTVSIEALSKGGEPWWFSLEGAINVGEGGNAAYGHHLENGGYLFFPLFYELSARAVYCGAESLQKRIDDLCRVYRLNGFDSDIVTWVEGLTGEFPESGLVSRVFVSSLCGVSAAADALEIRPLLPFGTDVCGIDRLQYGGKVFRCAAGRQTLELTGDALFCGTLRFFPQTTLPCRAELTKADGSTETLRLRPQDGCVTLRLDENVVSLVIRPDA